MKIYRNITDLPLKRLACGLIGIAAILVVPSLAQSVRTTPFSRNWGSMGRLIRNGFLARAVAGQDHQLIHDFMRDYWASPRSSEFYDHFEHRFDTLFLRYHRGIVEEIGKLISEFDSPEARIVEIGVGDARVLAHLAGNLPSVSKFHGIDLNEEIIAANSERFRHDPRFEFQSMEAADWLGRHPAGGTLLFTNGGVFEYFRRDQLVDLFRTLLAGGSPCGIALTETIGIDHDLKGDPNSFPYGHELAFSHNYPAILNEAGFEATILADRHTGPGEENHPARWLQVVATPLAS
jgi:hypothetical protein